MHWVEQNRHWFEKYVREVANQMGLRDWKIVIDDEPPEDEDAGAFNFVIYGRKVARLRFSTPESPEELRHWVTHELLHCHAALLGWNAQSIEPALSSQEYRIWHGGFHDAVELMIDGVAMAWAEFLPLPLHEIEVNHGSNHCRGVEADQPGACEPEPVAPIEASTLGANLSPKGKRGDWTPWIREE